jgi:hypothetical protein
LRERSNFDETIKCFYQNCDHVCGTFRSFQAHLSKYHINMKSETNLREEHFVKDNLVYDENGINDMDYDSSEQQAWVIIKVFFYLKKIKSS